MAKNPAGLTINGSSAEITALAAYSRTAAAWTLVSRITGLGRVVSVAAVLGPTYFGNLFQTLNILPNLVHDLLAGSLVTVMLVPPLARYFEQQDLQGARRLVTGFLSFVLLVFLATLGLILVAAPLLLALVTGAVRDPTVRDWQFQLGFPLLAMLMPQIFLYGIITIATAVQNAQRRFALAAGAPALENIGTIAVMVVSAAIFGVGADVGAMTSAHLLFLGLGSTSAVALHAAVQWWGAYRVGITLLPASCWRNLEVRSLIRTAIPSSVYTALGSSLYLGLLTVSGSLPGGAVAFQIGLNFFNVPVALCARPIAAAQLPLLARSIDQGDNAAFAEIYHAGRAFTIFVALPASLMFCGIAGPLAQAISFGGMAEPNGVVLVAAAIGSLSLGIIGEALFIVATSASYARRDTTAPLQAMVVRAVFTFGGMAAALWVMQGTPVLWMLGLSASAANLLGAAFLHGKLKKAYSLQARPQTHWLAGNLAAASAAAVSSAIAANWLANPSQTNLGKFGVAFAAILTGGTCYLVSQWLRNSEELRHLYAGALPKRTSRTICELEDETDSGTRASTTKGPP
jgi:putative peptidoglycan lipid II flippase